MGCGALNFLEMEDMINGKCYRKILNDNLELFKNRTSHFLQWDPMPQDKNCHKMVQ
jgi:hypothetical protein